MERKGIISVGNWIVDSVKFIEVFPKKGNLTTIVGQDEGLGGCAHNVLAFRFTPAAASATTTTARCASTPATASVSTAAT